MEFLQQYLLALWNIWFWMAGGLLTLNEIANKMFGRSWALPRQHRFKAAVAVLLMAQVGAYKNLVDETERSRQNSVATETAAAKAQTVAEAERSSYREQLADRDKRLDEKNRQIAELQSSLFRAPVPVDIRLQSAGLAPLPSYSLGGSETLMITWSEWELGWYPVPSNRDVTLDWSELTGIDVVAEIDLRVGSLSGRARIVDLTGERAQVAIGDWLVMRDQSKTPDKDKIFEERITQRLVLPTKTGRRTYRLEITGSTREAMVGAKGELTLRRRSPAQ